MNGFLLTLLFIVNEDPAVGASILQGEKICITKGKITPCLNC